MSERPLPVDEGGREILFRGDLALPPLVGKGALIARYFSKHPIAESFRPMDRQSLKLKELEIVDASRTSTVFVRLQYRTEVEASGQFPPFVMFAEVAPAVPQSNCSRVCRVQCQLRMTSHSLPISGMIVYDTFVSAFQVFGVDIVRYAGTNISALGSESKSVTQDGRLTVESFLRSPDEFDLHNKHRVQMLILELRMYFGIDHSFDAQYKAPIRTRLFEALEKTLRVCGDTEQWQTTELKPLLVNLCETTRLQMLADSLDEDSWRSQRGRTALHNVSRELAIERAETMLDKVLAKVPKAVSETPVATDDRCSYDRPRHDDLIRSLPARLESAEKKLLASAKCAEQSFRTSAETVLANIASQVEKFCDGMHRLLRKQKIASPMADTPTIRVGQLQLPFISPFDVAPVDTSRWSTTLNPDAPEWKPTSKATLPTHKVLALERAAKKTSQAIQGLVLAETHSRDAIHREANQAWAALCRVAHAGDTKRQLRRKRAKLVGEETAGRLALEDEYQRSLAELQRALPHASVEGVLAPGLKPPRRRQRWINFGEHYRKSRFVDPNDFDDPPEGPATHAKSIEAPDLTKLRPLAEKVALATDSQVDRAFALVERFISGAVFEEVTKDTPADPPEQHKIKRRILQELCDAGILEPALSKTSICRWAKLRFVHETDKEPKPHGRFRVILWSQQLNDETPLFADSAIRDAVTAATLVRPGRKLRHFDVDSGFWHLLLAEKARGYHGLMINGKPYMFTRGAMGSTWTAESMNTIVDILAFTARLDTGNLENVDHRTHVDDVGFFGEPTQCDIVAERFVALCKEYGFQIKEVVSTEPFLGMSCVHTEEGLLTGEVQVSQKTMSKFEASWQVMISGTATFADLREFASRVHHISRIQRVPGAEYFTWWKFYRRRCAAFTKGTIQEGDPAAIWKCALPDLQRLHATLLENAPVVHPSTVAEPTYLLYVDASIRGWGGVLFNEVTGEVVEVGQCWERSFKSRDIPVLETRAVSLAIDALRQHLDTTSGVLTILTDSTSMKGALLKGSSGDREMNEAVRSALSALSGTWQVQLAWVSTDHNLSDFKSRGGSYFEELASHVGPVVGRRLARAALPICVRASV